MVKLIDWESEPSQFNMQLQEHISWDQQKHLNFDLSVPSLKK